VSSSSAKTSSSQQQTTETTNLNLQDTGGVTVANSTGTRIVQTDLGTVKAAADISQAALNLGASAIDANTAVNTAGLDNALATYQSGLSFAGDVVAGGYDAANQSADRVSRFASDALDQNSALARTTIGAIGDASSNAIDANSNVLNFASSLFDNALGAQHALTDQNIGAVSALASQVSQSATQSTNDAVTKLATIVAIAVAAVFIFKGGH
jgi:hypothetical protein